MTLTEAIDFLAPCIPAIEPPAVWTDLGCGTGLFTNALASLLPPSSHIYAIDKQAGFVQMEHKGTVAIDTIQADFMHDLLPFSRVNGILMANSIHYVRDKKAFVSKMKKYVQEEGMWVIIEYDTTKPNAWIPYPVSFESLGELFRGEGYDQVVKKGERQSRYDSANMYCAIVKQ